MRWGILYGLGISLLATPLCAHAYDLNGWEIDNSWQICSAALEYEGAGGTLLVISYHIENDLTLLGVGNRNWSVKPDEVYKIDYTVNGWTYTLGAVGADLMTRKGFAAKASDDLLTSVASGSGLRIEMADTGTLIDNLNLKGSAAAIERLKSCRAKLRAQAAKEKRDKERLDYIPSDPFAKPSPPSP